MRWHTAHRRRAKLADPRRRLRHEILNFVRKAWKAQLKKILGDITRQVLEGGPYMAAGGVITMPIVVPSFSEFVLPNSPAEVPAGSYRCEECGGVFENGWSDEEAAAEAENNFPGMTPEDAATVCEDCFNDLMAMARGEGLVA
jgi:hypothetical protein